MINVKIATAVLFIVVIATFTCIWSVTAEQQSISPSPEQRILSYEANKSAGNMTADDYSIAILYAYIQHNNSLESAVENEALLKYPEYSYVYKALKGIYNGIGSMSDPNGEIGDAIYEYFRDPEFLAPFHAAVQARYAKEAQNRELDLQRAAIEQAAEHKKEVQRQQNKSNQLALDAHYKNLSENYTSNLTVLLNQSKFADALNLSDEAIKNLVSPYSNIMMISKGDIYTSMGRFEDAIESDQNAQKEFTYDNDSADYQNKVRQDFERDWNTIALYKTNLARQKLTDQIIAKKHDLRNAPNVNQLLSGHDGGRKYSFNVENDSYVGGGYIVSINLSAVNKPIDPTNKTDFYIKVSDDTKAFVPLGIDIFGGLFADKRVARVCIQNNETYLDRFGHKNEIAVWRVCMDNKTATRVGNWNDFKQYVGTDMDKLSSVAKMKTLNGGEGGED